MLKRFLSSAGRLRAKLRTNRQIDLSLDQATGRNIAVGLTSHSFVEATLDSMRGEIGRYEHDLSHYLRSLLPLLSTVERMPATFDLFHRLLLVAFHAEPVPFDPGWLDVMSDDGLLYDEHGELLEDSVELQGFAAAYQAVVFHIADYHRLKAAGILDQSAQDLFFGVRSPTGNSWYNFDALEFVAHGLWSREGRLEDGPDVEQSTWKLFAEIIIGGRIYE